jgi:hypothetical protein
MKKQSYNKLLQESKESGDMELMLMVTSRETYNPLSFLSIIPPKMIYKLHLKNPALNKRCLIDKYADERMNFAVGNDTAGCGNRIAKTAESICRDMQDKGFKIKGYHESDTFFSVNN